MPSQVIQQGEKKRLAPRRPKWVAVGREESLQQLPQRGTNRSRGGVTGPQNLRMARWFRIEGQQEEVVMGWRTQAIDKFRQKADDHGARVEAREIHHMVQL